MVGVSGFVVACSGACCGADVGGGAGGVTLSPAEGVGLRDPGRMPLSFRLISVME